MYEYEDQKTLAAKITGFRNSGMMNEAILLCQQATIQYPNNSFFPKLLGDIYRQIGQFSKSAEEYLKTLK